MLKEQNFSGILEAKQGLLGLFELLLSFEPQQRDDGKQGGGRTGAHDIMAD